MSIPYRLQQVLLKFVNLAYSILPQPLPPLERLRHCKIVSHRGEHNNHTILENTIPAFDLAQNNNVWGLEFDVRWTQDLQPVVIHDPTCKRLFDSSLVVQDTPFAQLREALPQIPSLSEVIEQYGKKQHLMVELKSETYPDPERQAEILQSLFANLVPGDDYHFISLHPQMFQHVSFVPPTALLPVSEFNAKALSQWALDHHCGGVTGHFLLLNQRMLQTHAIRGQKLGTGFVTSESCLFRELNRGVEWIFTNDALKLQKIVDQSLSRILIHQSL